MSHTPTPWKVSVVTDPTHGNPITRIKSGEHVVGRAGETDAAFIVRACNAHDELVAALTHLVRLLEPLEQSGDLRVPGLATLNGARAALAKVQAPEQARAA